MFSPLCSILYTTVSLPCCLSHAMSASIFVTLERCFVEVVTVSLSCFLLPGVFHDALYRPWWFAPSHFSNGLFVPCWTFWHVDFYSLNIIQWLKEKSGIGTWVCRSLLNCLVQEYFFRIFWCGSFLKSVLDLSQYCFCFMVWVFWLWGMWDLSPWPGTEPALPALEGTVLITGVQEKSYRYIF